MEPLRVCHLASGDTWAGAENQIAMLLPELALRRDLVLSAIVLNPGQLAHTLRARGVATTVLDERKGSSWRLFKNLVTHLSRQDIQVLKSGSTMEWELEQVLVDGQEQVTQITKFPVFGPDGNVIAIGGFNADITERKQSERALEESEKRFRMFSDAMPALFSYIDKDQRYRFCNLHYEKHFRRKRDQIIGMTINTFGRIT